MEMEEIRLCKSIIVIILFFSYVSARNYTKMDLNYRMCSARYMFVRFNINPNKMRLFIVSFVNHNFT